MVGGGECCVVGGGECCVVGGGECCVVGGECKPPSVLVHVPQGHFSEH